jgi:WhiB family redox-sensing transcriptional regulator
MVEVTAEAWMERALCRGANPSEFFPSDGSGVESAQRVCDVCPVRVECLEYALAHRIEHGVWGGASERERRRILRSRRIAARARAGAAVADDPTDPELELAR